MIDSKGLVTTTRGDKLPEHKTIMARKDGTPDMKDLVEIVKHVKPHAVVGLTGGGEAWGQVCIPFSHLLDASQTHLVLADTICMRVIMGGCVQLA